MEMLIWLGLYDKRWFFGLKNPSLAKIWLFPLVNNLLFLSSLMYSTTIAPGGGQLCNNNFATPCLWITGRIFILIMLVIAIAAVLYKTQKVKAKEIKLLKLIASASEHSILKLKYTFWLRRKVLQSLPGVGLFLLSIFNYAWVIAGATMFLGQVNDYSLSYTVQQIIVVNLVVTGIFLLPIIWTMCWFLLIKVTSAGVGFVSPRLYIWFMKKMHI